MLSWVRNTAQLCADGGGVPLPPAPAPNPNRTCSSTMSDSPTRRARAAGEAPGGVACSMLGSTT